MPEPLTNRQVRIVKMMHAYVLKHGYAPTLREVGAVVGLTSVSSVAHQIRVIKAKGWIREVENSRALTILDPDEPQLHSMTETERRTFRLAMLIALTEMHVDHPEAVATVLSTAIGPSFDQLVATRIGQCAESIDAAITGGS